MKTIQEIVKAKQATYKYFTKKESIEAVKKNGYALRYVNENLFIENPREVTMQELTSLLGYEIKIIN